MDMIPRFCSLNTRMILSHLLVALLTSTISMTLIAAGVTYYFSQVSPLATYRQLTLNTALSWIFGAPDHRPYPEGYDLPEGFGLVVDENDQVVFSEGDTPCHTGVTLMECAPQLVKLPPGETTFYRGEEVWTQIVQPVLQNQKVILQRGPFLPQLTLFLGDYKIYGNLPFIAVAVGIMTLIAVPTALILAAVVARPGARRISRLTQVSRAFTAGDYRARVHDARQDELGMLAQQFNTMADVLEHSITTLRDLARENAGLLQQVEQQAMQSERLRLARDLHDSLAQRLFSLSWSASLLPRMIADPQENQPVQITRITTLADQVARLAEEAQLDLRAMIVNLRPAGEISQNLVESLQTLCQHWSEEHHIPVETGFMLHGNFIPTGIGDILYRVAREALTNVARHARATSVALTLLEGNQRLTLSITDNGTGFDPDHLPDGHYGIIGMRERARTIGGEVLIESTAAGNSIGHGTTVQLIVPLNRDTTAVRSSVPDQT